MNLFDLFSGEQSLFEPVEAGLREQHLINTLLGLV